MRKHKRTAEQKTLKQALLNMKRTENIHEKFNLSELEMKIIFKNMLNAIEDPVKAKEILDWMFDQSLPRPF